MNSRWPTMNLRQELTQGGSQIADICAGISIARYRGAGTTQYNCIQQNRHENNVLISALVIAERSIHSTLAFESRDAFSQDRIVIAKVDAVLA